MSRYLWFVCASLLSLLGAVVWWATLRDRVEQPVALRGPLAREAYLGSLYADRYTYPTGRFDARWLLDAKAQFERVETGIPTGAVARASRNLLPDQATALGPMPLIQTGNGAGIGAVAGRINVVLSHPSNPAIAWVGSDGGGIWKTTTCCTAATTWRAVSDDPSINSIAIGDMTLDPSNPDVLYAGTGDLRFGSFSFGAAGVLKSVDGGESWTVLGSEVFNPVYPTPVGAFPQTQAIGAIRVDPTASNRVVVGTKTGLFFSADAGQNWSGPCLSNLHTSQRQDITDLAMRVVGGQSQIIAAVGTRGFGTPVQPDLDRNGANGVYAATMPSSGCPTDWTLLTRADNGWPPTMGDGQPDPEFGRLSVAVAPSDPNVIVVKAADGNSTAEIRGIWRSGNGGQSWTEVSTPRAFDCAFANTQSWYNAGLLIHPSNPNIFFASAVDVFRSTNAGASVDNITCGYSGGNVHVDQHGRTFVAGNANRLLISGDGGVYVSNDPYTTGGRPSFVSLNQALPTIEFYSGDITANFANANSRGAVGGAQDNGTSVSVWTGPTTTAQAWQAKLGGDGMFARIEPVLAQRWYMSSQRGDIVASTTGPNGVLNTIVNPNWASDRKSFITPFELYHYGGEASCPSASGCNRMIAGTFRVWESVQGGIPNTSWVVNSPDLTDSPPTLGNRAFINQLSHAVSDPTVAIVGTNDGNVWMGFGLGAGIANSASWVNVTAANAVVPNRPILDVNTDPTNPLHGYAVIGGFDQNTPSTPGHVFALRCTARCASFSWRNISGNLPNIPANAIAANPRNRAQVYVGTDWGLFYTDNVDAATPIWRRFSSGLPSAMVWDLTIDRGFTTLAVWTRSRGAYVIPLPDVDTDRLFIDGFEG